MAFAQWPNGIPHLHAAASTGDVESLKYLLRVGLDKHAQHNGNTALHVAANAGHVAVVRALLEAGADTEIRDTGGNTALHLASFTGNVAVVRTLLDAGADKDARASKARTPLHLAAITGNVAIARALLEAGAHKDAKGDNRCDTPLHAAAMMGHAPCARALLEAGAATTARSAPRECTPLHLACRHARPGCVLELLRRGADPLAQEGGGGGHGWARDRSPLHVVGLGASELEDQVGVGLDCAEDEQVEEAGGELEGPDASAEQVRARNFIRRALRAEVRWRRRRVLVLLRARLAAGPGGSSAAGAVGGDAGGCAGAGAGAGAGTGPGRGDTSSRRPDPLGGFALHGVFRSLFELAQRVLVYLGPVGGSKAWGGGGGAARDVDLRATVSAACELGSVEEGAFRTVVKFL